MFETKEIVEGYCPDCGQPYGYVLEVTTGQAVNEFSHCLCDKAAKEEDITNMHRQSFMTRSEVA